MNREDIIRMAIEAKLNLYVNDITEKQYIEVLERFATLVIANHPPQSYMTWQEGYETGKQTERQACKALHDHEDVQAPIGNSSWGEAYQEGWAQGTAAYRDAIKARGQA